MYEKNINSCVIEYVAIKTYSTKLIFNSEEDKEAVLFILEEYKDAVNECSILRFNNKINNNICEIHNLFYRQFRNNNPHLQAQIPIRAENEVLSIFRNIKSKNHKISKPPEKKTLSLRLDKNLISYKNKIFSLVSIKGRVKCQPYLYPKLQGLMEKYPFCDPLILAKNNEIYIYLSFEIPKLLSSEKLCLGVDLGVKNFAATSDGKLFRDKKFNARKRRLRYLKSCLKSKGTKSAKRHLKKLQHKEHNINHNFIHHLINNILKTNADIIAIEDLRGIKIKKHKFQNKNRISQIPLCILRQVLSYKAQLLNKKVVTVNPAYTSQIDHRTGLKDGIRQGSRYTGKDGEVLHADINAACNIAIRSKPPGSICFARNNFAWQAYINEPIVQGPS